MSQKELKARLQVLMKRPENMVCTDCPERQPRWASLIVPPPGSPQGALPIGAFCCLECSGSHRRLGVHISFVRSVNLDSWKEREVLAMENGGNSKVNAIFEARLRGEKPQTGADGRTRERFIRDKYERRKFFDQAALQNFYTSSNDEEDEDSDEEEEEEEVPRRRGAGSASRRSVPTPKIRAPSDAAKKRAEKRRGNRSVSASQSTDDDSTGRSAPSSPPEPNRFSSAPAPVAEPVMDLLDFGSIPTQADPGPPPAPPSQQSTPLVASHNFANGSSSSAPFPGAAENSTVTNGNPAPAAVDPFAVISNPKSVEVSVKAVSSSAQVSTTVDGQQATVTSSVSQEQQKQKQLMSSDDIMKMFQAPQQQQFGGMMCGMNPAGNMANGGGMMNPGMMGGMAPMGGNSNGGVGGANGMSPMMMNQFNASNNYMMTMMQQQQQPGVNGNANMMQQNQLNMMMMQQQMQQLQMNSGAGGGQQPQQQGQQAWNGAGGMMQNPMMNGMNMSQIAMMNRLQMGNAPNAMMMMGTPTTTAAGGQPDKSQQGQPAMNQFQMNGF